MRKKLTENVVFMVYICQWLRRGLRRLRCLLVRRAAIGSTLRLWKQSDYRTFTSDQIVSGIEFKSRRKRASFMDSKRTWAWQASSLSDRKLNALKNREREKEWNSEWVKERERSLKCEELNKWWSQYIEREMEKRGVHLADPYAWITSLIPQGVSLFLLLSIFFFLVQIFYWVITDTRVQTVGSLWYNFWFAIFKKNKI